MKTRGGGITSSGGKWRNYIPMDRVDEGVFKGLYDEKQGAPNAPLRVLVAMQVLKEGSETKFLQG